MRIRTKELRTVRAGDLLEHPLNWRTHPASQLEPLRAAIDYIGFAGALEAVETPNGLMLVDGHARRELVPDELVPVLVLDLDETEAQTYLATRDPLAAAARLLIGKV